MFDLSDIIDLPNVDGPLMDPLLIINTPSPYGSFDLESLLDRPLDVRISQWGGMELWEIHPIIQWVTGQDFPTERLIPILAKSFSAGSMMVVGCGEAGYFLAAPTHQFGSIIKAIEEGLGSPGTWTDRTLTLSAHLEIGGLLPWFQVSRHFTPAHWIHTRGSRGFTAYL